MTQLSILDSFLNKALLTLVIFGRLTNDRTEALCVRMYRGRNSGGAFDRNGAAPELQNPGRNRQGEDGPTLRGGLCLVAEAGRELAARRSARTVRHQAGWIL